MQIPRIDILMNFPNNQFQNRLKRIFAYVYINRKERNTNRPRSVLLMKKRPKEPYENPTLDALA